MLNRDARARRQASPRATLRGSLGCVEGTAPAGGWVRRPRRRATERRRAGKRRIKLSLTENFCFSDQHSKLQGAFCFSGRGEKGNRLELIVNESKCERAGRVS